MKYVDTSVLVPFYVPEARSAEAMALLRGAQDLYLSDLTLAEFSVTVWRKVRDGHLPEAAAMAVLAELDDHCAYDLYRVEPLTPQSQVELALDGCRNN